MKTMLKVWSTTSISPRSCLSDERAKASFAHYILMIYLVHHAYSLCENREAIVYKKNENSQKQALFLKLRII